MLLLYYGVSLWSHKKGQGIPIMFYNTTPYVPQQLSTEEPQAPLAIINCPTPYK